MKKNLLLLIFVFSVTTIYSKNECVDTKPEKEIVVFDVAAKFSEKEIVFSDNYSTSRFLEKKSSKPFKEALPIREPDIINYFVYHKYLYIPKISKEQVNDRNFIQSKKGFRIRQSNFC